MHRRVKRRARSRVNSYFGAKASSAEMASCKTRDEFIVSIMWKIRERPDGTYIFRCKI